MERNVTVIKSRNIRRTQRKKASTFSNLAFAAAFPHIHTLMTTYSASSGDHAVWNQVQAEPDGMEYVPEQQYDLESQHILSDIISDLEDGCLAGGQGGEPGGEGGESWEGGEGGRVGRVGGREGREGGREGGRGGREGGRVCVCCTW